MVKIGVIFCSMGTSGYLTYFSVAVMPGDKFLNGIILGIGMVMACFLSGLLMKTIKDVYVFVFLTTLCALGNILYNFSNPANGNIWSMFFLLVSVLGVGGATNTSYFLMEARMPPERQGSAMVILLTFSLLTSSQSSQIAYFAYPTPLIVIVSILILASIFAFTLPEPINI